MSNLSEIKEKIKEIVYQATNIEPAEIADDAHFVNDIGLDSLTLMEIGVDIDQEFGLDLDDEEMKGFIDVNASAELVLEKAAVASF